MDSVGNVDSDCKFSIYMHPPLFIGCMVSPACTYLKYVYNIDVHYMCHMDVVSANVFVILSISTAKRYIMCVLINI